MLRGLPEFRPGDHISLPPTDLHPKTFAAVERAKLEFIRAMSETADAEAMQVAARVCFDSAYLAVARGYVGEFSVLHDPQPHEFAWNGNLPLFFHDRMLQACGLEGTLSKQVPIIALRALRALPEYDEALKLFTDPIIETYEQNGKAGQIRAQRERHLEKHRIPGDHTPQGSVRLAAIFEFLGGVEHITELEHVVRCEIADRCAQQPPELPGWLPSDVTEGDFKRCLRTIEQLPKEGLQFLSKAQAELRQLIKDGTPTSIVVSTLLGGYAKTFFYYASTEKDQLVMLAILEERVRVGVRTGGRISFGKAPELVVDLGVMTDANINAVEAELAVRIAGMERFIRSGASFDHYPKHAVFVESHSSTQIDIGGREAARVALRGYTEDTADLVSDQDYSEAAHLKAVQAAAEVLYTCRARDAIEQHGEHAFPRLADPIARDVVLDLCRLRVLAIPYGIIRRTRASVGETGRPDDQTHSLMQQDLDNALRGKPGMQIEVRKWAEPKLSELINRYRSTATMPKSRAQEADSDESVAMRAHFGQAQDASSVKAPATPDATAQERRSHFKRCVTACKEIVPLKSTPKQQIVAFIAGVSVREFGAYLGNEKKKDGSDRLSDEQIQWCREAVELLSNPEKAEATLQIAYNRAEKNSDGAVLSALARTGFRPLRNPNPAGGYLAGSAKSAKSATANT